MKYQALSLLLASASAQANVDDGVQAGKPNWVPVAYGDLIYPKNDVFGTRTVTDPATQLPVEETYLVSRARDNWKTCSSNA
jgi:hypothetical protein